MANLEEEDNIQNIQDEENASTSKETLGNMEKDSIQQQAEDKILANIATAEEYLMGVQLLNYEKQMLLDMVYSDGLMVCAKGLSYERVVLNILKVYSDSGNLLLVINGSDWEENYYKSQIEKKFLHEVANTATERERVYLEGGIQFMTTRILVVDLLKQRIPIELITGIVVLRAHTIIESCQEAFALRLYRQRNKTGFIKAFSGSAEAFTIGYGHIERIMRNLFVRELFIWPRFHATVQSSLKPYEAQIVELHVPLSGKMESMQANILDLMNYLVREIKRINRMVDLEVITVENCVTKKFHKILQSQLDCIWHQLNSQTKLIVADLKILRNLMISTMYNDAISAYALIKRYRTTEYALSNSGWTLLDAAEKVFKLAKERVYNEAGEFEPEPCPKWKYLSEILKVEIPGDMKRSETNKLTQPKVLIFCQDTRTCYQLKQYLTQSGEQYLLYVAMRHQIPIGKLSKRFEKIKNGHELEMSLSQKQDTVRKTQTCKQTLNKTDNQGKEESLPDTQAQPMDELTQLLSQDDLEDLQEGNFFQESYLLTMTQPLLTDADLDNMDTTDDDIEGAVGISLQDSIFEPFPEMENMDITATVAAGKQPLICLQTFKTERDGPLALERILNDIQPQYTMVIPEYQDGKTDEAFVLYKTFKDPEVEANNAQSRKAGGQQTNESSSVPKIIVDMREFRSDLPCLIHKRGLEVVPVTITIGDYILTPEICVERKSISDLIGSLNSGRLYNQCIQMQRYYAKPILLIEFDQNKPFHLQGKYMLSQNTTSTNVDIVQKLQLLTLHFPKLRLIWSPSPYATAQLFEELKLGKPEPDAKQAATLGIDEIGSYDDLKFNANIYDFLLRLPGINTRNIHQLMRHGGNLKELLKKSQIELSTLLDSQENGKLLWDILHVAHLPEKDEISGSNALLAAGKQFVTHTRFRRGAAASLATRGRLTGKFNRN
uniref:DNA repair endonuclease XPF n=1 Tax=Glossina morsitans morsitans TaxID=37546 RepID=A0A1B0FGJ6_GLOMM